MCLNFCKATVVARPQLFVAGWVSQGLSLVSFLVELLQKGGLECVSLGVMSSPGENLRDPS